MHHDAAVFEEPSQITNKTFLEFHDGLKPKVRDKISFPPTFAYKCSLFICFFFFPPIDFVIVSLGCRNKIL